MSRRVTKKEIRNSNRKDECAKFHSIIANLSPLRGIIIHSKGEGGTGKTTLLKMFESDCQSTPLPQSTIAFYFTARRPLDWQLILNSAVDRLGVKNFPKYSDLSGIYAASGKDIEKTRPTVTYETHINSIVGPVHTGSGQIEGVFSLPTSSNEPTSMGSTKLTLGLEEIRSLLTQTFLNELKNLPKPLLLVWLIDTTEKLDINMQTWLIDLFDQIADGSIDRLVLVTAGQKSLGYEPYWIDKVEEIYIGNFNEATVMEIVQKIWGTAHPALHQGMTELLMKESGGKPMDLITHIESFNPYS